MKTPINGIRQEILTLLKRRGPLPADELAHALGVSGVAVRQHLDALAAEGLVVATLERRPLGRPRHRFALTDAANDCFPCGYEQLAASLLEQVVAQDGAGRLTELLAGRRQRLLEELRPRLAGADLESELQMLARIQSDAGHMAELEARDDGSYLLRQHHCPVCRVARCFPQLCEQERQLFSELLDIEVMQEQHQLQGDRCCSFVIRPRRPS